MSRKLTTEQRTAKIKNKHNAKLIKKFLLCLEAEGKKEIRIVKYWPYLTNVSNWLKKDFEKATKNDIQDIILKLNDQTQWGKHDYKTMIKKFYKWLEGDNEEYPKKVRWIKSNITNIVTVKPSDILSREEIINMIEATDSLRNKAIISTLAETGMRSGELLNMKIGDIKVNEMMIIISISGKTGQRTVFVRGFKQHLLNWLNTHPYKINNDSYLWIDNVKKEKVISHTRLCDMIKRIALKSGMEKKKAKKMHAHIFRHTLATLLASKLTEQELKVLFGWSQASRMASIYCHLSAHDIENSVASKVYGLTNGEIKEKEDALKPKVCDNCGRENPADARFCNCGTVLDLKTAIDLDKKLKDAKFVDDKIRGKDVLQMFTHYKELEKKIEALMRNG